ncbi:MAG TPA: PIN domain-containing protein [Verrucomicrobiae bacterium]
MIYLDTGVLVRALLQAHPEHKRCVSLLSENAASSCHSLAELFNTLTGFFKVPNDVAAEAIDSVTEEVRFEPILQSDYLKIVREARQRGIQGGIIYDALHAEIARRLKVEKIITYNITNFRHVAPDLECAIP